MPTVDTAMLERAREAARIIAPLAGQIESDRRLPPDAVSALVTAGAYKLYVPKALGGFEAPLGVAVGVLEELARADGSAGWCAMIGATSGLMSAFLEEAVAREIYGAVDARTSGVFAPMGRAVPVEGGFRVSGRWPFASGCEHASWRMAGAFIVGGTPDLLPSGAPNVQCFLFRATDTRVLDTWHTSGLRGTGSHDMEVSDVFVPKTHSFSLLRDPPRHAGPLYAMPFFGVLAASIAAVAIGIASSAIEQLSEAAKTKVPPGAKKPISHRDLVQLDVAEAEAKVSSARAFLREAIAGVEADVTLTSRARLRLAGCHAVREAAAAVDAMYNAGGASAVYDTSPLQRHFRDVHVAMQHLMVSRTIAMLAGRVLLGVESNTDML
jgi:alkylation response protein AidB-like acyl-CoA dehydrogenase